jgi:ATP-dependent Lon protease
MAQSAFFVEKKNRDKIMERKSRKKLIQDQHINIVAAQTPANIVPNPLPPESLRWHCPEEIFSFNSTRELTPLKGIVGQDRAIEAIKMGAELFSHGYNVFVSGISGTGRLTTVQQILDEVTVSCPPLYDYCYVQNFTNPDMPRLLKFAAGQGKQFSKAIDEGMLFLRRRIPQLFDEEGFQTSRKDLINTYQKQEQELISQFAEKIRPSGFVLGQVENEDGDMESEIFPLINNKPVHMTELDELVSAKKITQKKADTLREQYQTLHNELFDLARTSMKLMQTFRQKLLEYDKSAAAVVVRSTFDTIRDNFPSEMVSGYLRAMEQDLLDNLEIFLPVINPDDEDAESEKPAEEIIREKFASYSVNVVLDNSATQRAPVIVETTPSFVNLFGTIEKKYDVRGFWRTDFTQIKPGSLLRADQGYLIVNALDVLSEPGVWPVLKRLLLYGKLEIQSVDSYFQISQTLLKPEAIDLNVKVIMIGEADIYHALYFGEEDFRKIFKVNAEFDYETQRSGAMIHNYAFFIHKLCEQESLLHFDRSGVAAIIEWGVAHTETQRKITLQFSDVADLVRESSYFARKDGSGIISRVHVQQARNARLRRNDIMDEKIREQMLNGTLMIQVNGRRAGQVNGLTVYDTGLVSFGKPARITATVGVGSANIVNIEREADLSGNIHNKGMMIIEGFLRERFAREHPITLSASLCFEQSYGGVDGDSATAAEIIALISALCNIPVLQSLAITGSMNQKGDIQPVGGVNEKIKGFFELCAAQGLNGEHGVLIPSLNVQDLMVEEDIIQAVEQGNFHIYPISTIEEAVALMLGMPAGEKDPKGNYQNGIFHEISIRLHDLYEKANAEPTKKKKVPLKKAK